MELKALIVREAKSFLSRKLLLWVGVLLCLASAGAALVWFQNYAKLPGAVELKLDARLNQVERSRSTELQTCMQGIDRIPEFPEPPRTREECERLWTQSLAGLDRDRFHFAQLQAYVVGLSAPLTIAAIVIAGGLVGAELSSGFLATVLTWDPRRTRMVLAKVAAVATICFLGAFTWLALLEVAALPAAIFRGTFYGVDAEWTWATAGAMVRTSASAAVGGAIGSGLALIAGSTVSALTFAFILSSADVYLVESRYADLSIPWSLVLNVLNFAGTAKGVGPSRTTWGAGTLILIYATVVTVAAAVRIRKRDIT